MKKMEYSEALREAEIQQTLDAGKHDECQLPDFSKEVPDSNKKTENGNTIHIDYHWKNKSPSAILKVDKIDFRKGEELEGFYRVAARDGADSITFTHNNSTFIMRKTLKEIAQALYNAYGKVKGALENIVGYLKTVLGTRYVIAKVESEEAWSFDKRISRGNINYVDVDNLEKKNKSRLSEMITEKLAELHANNLIIGRFSLNNVLLNSEDVEFTDLRRLRVSRKRSFVIEEFKNVLQYLLAIGFVSREDIYCSIAYYAQKNEETCNEWYREHTGENANDLLDVVSKIEEDVYC
ncbi:hypothetical protein GF318_04000 [Candidatus Micrarchaeota archaeon]|nr:hypothetical protein [Candidatus Micrarchaeota archaeon]